MPQPKTKSNTQKMTHEEFFKWHERQELRYDLVDGRPYLPPRMQAGTSLVHDKVTMNALGCLYGQLRGKTCRPCTADVAIQLPAGNIRYPDVSIDCGDWQNSDKTAQNPWLVLETLSPSTRSMDTIHKLEEYKTVPSLRAIILVETFSPHAMVYTRPDEKTDWHLDIFTAITDVLDFPDLEVKLPLSDVYEGVTFEDLEGV